jgi:hypothetical protein
MRAIALHPRVALFTSPENDPARLARALITAGYGDEVKISIACRLQMPDERLFADLAANQVANRDVFPNRTSCSSNGPPTPVDRPSVSKTSNTGSDRRRKV